MANKQLFGSALPADVTHNHAGGVAFALGNEAALAQYVMTGVFNDTFCADAKADMARVVELARSVDVEFLAKLAVFGREKGFMKDAPALLLAILSVRAPALFRAVFARVADNGRMMRTFVQIVRSGVAGRRSLGTGPQRAVAGWLEAASDRALVNALGQAPTIGDVIRLARPKAAVPAREALLGYFIGKVAANDERLPDLVKHLEAFKAGGEDVPNVDFRLLTSLPLTAGQWKSIARNAPWQATRMNLNTFARHGVFGDPELVQLVADRLRDREQILAARVFPYQLLAAYRNIGEGVPGMVGDALIDAAEVATENVPTFAGKVYVFPDVSGSMRSPVTGYRAGATSKVSCVDVAGLMAAAILRRNPDAEVLPFSTEVEHVRVSARDPILTTAAKFAEVGGGGTACSAPLVLLNAARATGDLLVYVSDNESWFDTGRPNATATQIEWKAFKARNPGAKLACIDITPNATVQARSDQDVLNVGGFSDAVFEALRAFAGGDLSGDGWVTRVSAVQL